MQLSFLFDFDQGKNDTNRSGAMADEGNGVMFPYFLLKLSQTRMWQALSPSICQLSPFCFQHNHLALSTPINWKFDPCIIAFEELGEEVE